MAAPPPDDGEPVGTDRLGRYRAKRDFERTPEPAGEGADTLGAGTPASRFVVQKHDARRLHYDFRLEADGVLVSWAVPKGPSLDPAVKRLAVHVEDHPLDYRDFEGVIPGAQYGSGTVIVWDEGTYRNLTARSGTPVAITDAVAAGHLSVWLDGAKLRGGWSLTRTGDQQWILVKRSDDLADAGREVTVDAPQSVKSGRSLEQVGADRDADEWTAERATWVPPMLASLTKAADPALTSARWRFERKLDGLRCVAVRNGDEVSLWSRNHLSFNRRFPELASAIGRLPVDNVTIDGEIVAYDGERTSFALLQRGEPGTRPVFCAFDLLHLLGRDTTGLPLADRLALLSQTLDGAPENLVGVAAEEGHPEPLLQRACAGGWEGVVAKRLDAPYRSGRSGAWRKLKCSASQELVVGGWTDPTGTRTGFGALLVGYHDEEGFRYAGKVGTGFDQATLRDLAARLQRIGRADSPFSDRVRVKGAHWVEPRLVVAVAFTEWTGDGRLRHPAFQGLRTDKSAASVRRERP